MKTKTMKKVLNAVAIAAIALVASACSDGQLRQEAIEFSVSPASPVIISFYADPVEVKSGGQTTIFWEVANADSVEITSLAADGSSPLHVESSDIKGTAIAKDLTSTTDFTITAKMSADASAESEGGEAKSITINARFPRAEETAPEGDTGATGGGTAPVPASQTITVKVVKEEKVEATVTADKTNIAASENTIIRWSVKPADATIEVVDSAQTAVEPTFTGEDCKKTDAADLLNTGTPAEKPAAEGCAVVAPEATTIYTVTGKTASGATGSGEVEIQIAANGMIAEILVNGVTVANVPNYSDPITVSWIAEPVGSKVAVTANPAPESCEPALPQGEIVDYASSVCKISGATTFNLHVEDPVDSSKTADAEASVSVGNASADLDIRSDEWAFEGEQVTLEIKAKEGTESSAIKEIRIKDLASAGGIMRVTLPLGAPIKVTVPRDGVQIEMEDQAGSVHDYGTRVRALATIDEEVAGPVTALSFDPLDAKVRYAGIMQNGWNKGIARIYRNGGELDVDFGSPMKAFAGLAKYWQEGALDSMVKTFPVNAIAVRPGKPNEIYVGVTGAVVMSTDGGKSFSLVGPVFRISENGSDYSGSHPSCRGQSQTGVKASYSKQLVSLNQVCDITVTAAGRLIVATDSGSFSISNIDAYMANDETVQVVGHPKDTKSADSEGFLTYGHVVDDVECLDADCTKVLAATDRGILVSENGGETWAEFGSSGGKAYKVVHLGEDLYAATDSGVLTSSAASASWTALGLAAAAKSITVDPNVGQFGRMLIAATDSGVYVTRDSGSSWSTLAASGQTASSSVAIASTDAPTGGKIVTVMIGSGNKVVYGQAGVGIVEPTATPEEAKAALSKAGMDQAIVSALTK